MEKTDSETKRIVLVGSESTGKTTLAKKLVKYFRSKGGVYSNTQWVEEYGRYYTYEKLEKLKKHPDRDKMIPASMDQLVWTEEDFIQIGKIQNKKEDELAKVSGPVLICDTDAFATAIWYERYMNHWSVAMEPIINQMKKRSLYLLCDHKGAKFKQDEIRDGENFREWMTQKFEEEMTKRHFPYVKLQGGYKERFLKSIQEIEKILA